MGDVNDFGDFQLVDETAEIHAYLKRRADTYWRDAAELDKDGDSVMAIAYWAIASELRACVAHLAGDADGGR